MSHHPLPVLISGSNYLFGLKYLYRQSRYEYQSVHTLQTGTDVPEHHLLSVYLQTKDVTNSLGVCALFPDFVALLISMQFV